MPTAPQLLEAAVAHHRAGRLADAQAAYQEVLALEPRNPDALHLLGFVAHQQGAHERAAELISQALAIDGSNAHAHCNLGRVHEARGAADQALACYRKAVELAPDHVEALFRLAHLLDAKGELEPAIAGYRHVLSLRPQHAAAHCNLGIALASLGRREEAVAAYANALQHQPAFFEARFNLGIALRELGRGEEAIEAFSRALELRPEVAAVHYALGHLLRDQDRLEEARAAFGRALACDADHVEARWSMAMSELPLVYGPGQDPDACRARFAEELARLAEWFDDRRSAAGFAAVGSDQPFALAYQEKDNRELLVRHGELCARLMSRWHEAQRLGIPSVTRTTGPVRVGIVSAHFREHSVWNAILKGWFQRLDPTRFELVAFDLGTGEDAETRLARSRAARYEAGPKDLRTWTQAILRHEPEVLIYPEIGMDPLTARLAGLRLAPVQAASWGHPETTGLPTMDYYLSAEDLEPEGAQRYYGEQLVALPRLGCYFEPLRPEPGTPDFERWGIDPELPLLVCPGVPFKYAPQDDGLLLAIVQRLGACHLLFFRHWKRALSERLEERLRRAFAAARLDYEACVRFIPWQPRAAFYGILQRADVYLDTVGFSGFNTALQALECGLPVVAREGRFLRGRLASGILKRLGLAELVAQSNGEYIERAARLVEDPDYSERIAERIAQARPAIYRDIAPIHALERFLEKAARG